MASQKWSPTEAIRYANFAETSFSWRCIERPSLRSLIQPYVNGATTALDLGCGGGRIIRLLRQLGVAERSIFGIDSDITLIEIARKSYPAAKLICHDLTELPHIGVPEVNIVTAHFVLQYLTVIELRQCLTELHSLLVPDGFLAIGLPHPMRVAQQAGASYFSQTSHRIPAPWGGLTTSSSLTVSEYLNCIIQSGFALQRIEEPQISPACGYSADANSYQLGPTRLMILARASGA